MHPSYHIHKYILMLPNLIYRINKQWKKQHWKNKRKTVSCSDIIFYVLTIFFILFWWLFCLFENVFVFVNSVPMQKRYKKTKSLKNGCKQKRIDKNQTHRNHRKEKKQKNAINQCSHTRHSHSKCHRHIIEKSKFHIFFMVDINIYNEFVCYNI